MTKKHSNRKHKKRNGKKPRTKKMLKTTEGTLSKKKKTLKHRSANKKNITRKEIKEVAKVQIKKSFKDRQRKIIKTSYLVFLLVFSVLAVIVINLRHYFPPSKSSVQKLVPLTLKQIMDEKEFLDVQNSLVEKLTPPSGNDTLATCQNNSLLNSTKQRSVVVNKKYLAILKRGKIFIVNLDTNKYITKTEVSPVPKKEKEAIQYDNIYATGNIVAVTGYRTNKNSLELSLFELSPNGNLIRKSSYDLPSNKCLYDGRIVDDKFIGYTVRNLRELNYSLISAIDIWDEKQNIFNNKHINNSQVFYNDLNLNAPVLHTITTCQIKDSVLKACHQQHFIDNKIDNLTISSNHLYAWTSHRNDDQQIKRTIPNSLIYQINLQDEIQPMVVQVEGTPVSKEAVNITDKNYLQATVYQNNTTAPAWLNNFSQNRLALFSVDLNKFNNNGFIINNPQNYKLITPTISYSPEVDYITQNTILLISEPSSADIKVVKDDNVVDLNIPQKILTVYNIPTENKALLLYTRDNNLHANWLDYSNNVSLGQEMVLANNVDKQATQTINTEINDFKIGNKRFISLPIVNQTKNTGQLYLIQVDSDNIQKVATLSINKNLQKINDGCQNSCQESWTKLLTFFPGQNLSKIYAFTGSYLKSFKFTTQNKLQLLRTINYTTKPAPPKPRRPKAKIPVGAKVVNGKYVCKKKHDYVGKSKKNNKGYLHLDMECCLDPDEYPNPWCTYRPGELNVTKLRYKDYHGKVKIKKHH